MQGAGGSWSALERLLEWPEGVPPNPRKARGELEEDQAAARGGVGERFSTTSPWAKGFKVIKVYKGSKDSRVKGQNKSSKRLRPKGSMETENIVRNLLWTLQNSEGSKDYRIVRTYLSTVFLL